MAELTRTELAVQSERALLVGVLLPDSQADPYNPLGELDRLAKTAGAEVVDYIVQRRDRVDPAYYIGSGKAEEIRERAQASEATLVIFDNDLSPGQIRELEQLIGCKILDRSELILDIFAARARTHQAKLQVELAQLEYTAPRLRGMWTHLERIAGAGGASGAGMVGGIGTRGPGERQIEIDRRLVSKRISILKDRLAEIDQRKQREVRSRGHEFTLSLVGYTNSGKSTLLNALTGAGTLTQDKLFSTLDTLTRQWKLSGGQVALVSDTVGFVRDLPHHLVASFRATLEEALHADLLLHVVDVAGRNAEREMNAVNRVLTELGCTDQPTLVLLNKIDAVQNPAELQIIESRVQPTLRISARSGDGLAELHDLVLDKIRLRARDVTIRIGPGNGRALAFLDKHAQVLDRKYYDDAIELAVRISPSHLNQLQSRIDGIEILTVSTTDNRP
ncbi:MAG: GTPase HflX [Phycisphaerae bacterium]|nr:GTPase HflX [Phycisphaerae bacterium]